MPTTHWDTATRAALYVRADLPTPAQQCQTTAIARLESVVASGALSEFSVTSWAKRVPVSPDHGTGEFERDVYATLSEWADEVGVELCPFFDTRQCYSSVTGERRTELVLPAVCLVVYDGDDDVVSVAPHATGTETVTVRDALARLAEESTDERRLAVGTAD